MSNWYNLFLSLLLLGLCILCVVEIGTSYSFVGGGRSSIETRLEHGYKFYNRDMLTLLSSLSISFLDLFFLGRFISSDTKPLNWKHLLSFLPFTFIFCLAFVSNYRNILFKCHLNYFVALGLITSLIILFIYLILKRSTPQSFEDILDQA